MTVAKGPDAFRTISEAATELGVPQHVLRFWESKFSFIRPMKRAGGRRFYRRQDIDILRGVRALLHDEGYTIKGVQRLHREQSVRRLILAAGVELDASEGDAAHEVAAPFQAPPPATTSEAAHSAALQPQPAPLHEPPVFQAPEPASIGELRQMAPLLSQAARARLTHVLGDLDAVRLRIDRLLTTQ